MNFANITDVKIGNSNVVKIQKAEDGCILWEKKQATSENTYNFVVKATNALASVEKAFSITVGD